MPPDRDRHDAPTSNRGSSFSMSRYVVGAVALHVRCEELFYYTASTLLRSNRNFDMSAIQGSLFAVLDKIVPQLCRIRPSCCEEIFLCYCVARGAFVDAASLRVVFSPHLVYAILGTSMAQLACLPSSAQFLRAHDQPQMNVWAFDTVPLRYLLSRSLVQVSATLVAFGYRKLTVRTCLHLGELLPRRFRGLVLRTERLISKIVPRVQLCYPRPECN